ncbi:NnrU family protein, partial [Staphylococcus aureus]|uniref:NnrU family protein n=1 Tax=Staphylococcus aureus TaxID=1280 RepID=UPI0039BDA98C
RVHHPQVLAVKTWAFGHLLATGMLHDVVLFGAFLLWAVVLFAASRRRDRREGTVYPPGTLKGTAIAIVGGAAAWAVFAFWLHALLIGVKPVL